MNEARLNRLELISSMLFLPRPLLMLFLKAANCCFWVWRASIAAVLNVWVAFFMSWIRSSKISSILWRRFSAFTLNRSIWSRRSMNSVEAIPDSIVDSIIDHGSPIPILLSNASMPIPQMATTLPPNILMMASPFSAADIWFACLPNRTFPACANILIPSFTTLRICLKMPMNRLMIPSISEEMNPFTNSHTLSPRNDMAFFSM